MAVVADRGAIVEEQPKRDWIPTAVIQRGKHGHPKLDAALRPNGLLVAVNINYSFLLINLHGIVLIVD